MSKYIPTIGLEIHAELKTESKMFCSCKNDPNEKQPNVNICPICMGHPGTLPVPNEQTVHMVVKTGLALVHHSSVFKIRPEELFLPRPSQGLSNKSVRFASLPKRQIANRGARYSNYQNSFGGRYGQVAARERQKPFISRF